VRVLLGIDLTEVDRVERVLARWGDRFVDRVFRPGEISRRRRHVAGRFAAKEATMKALGTGWRGLGFRDIEVGRDPRGKPVLTLYGKALARAQALRVASMEVSITHSSTIAAAVVALVAED
jgi:holo-[acyl-carrier protein] synthase